LFLQTQASLISRDNLQNMPGTSDPDPGSWTNPLGTVVYSPATVAESSTARDETGPMSTLTMPQVADVSIRCQCYKTFYRHDL
jgi:hypothetical protein